MKLISVGQLIDQTWEHYHVSWRELMSVTVWLLLPAVIAIIATAMYPNATTMLAARDFSVTETSAVVTWFLNNALLAPIIGLWVFLMTVKMIYDQMAKRKINFSSLAKDGWKLFFPTIFVNLLVCLVLIASWLMIVPGLIFYLLGLLFNLSWLNGIGVAVLSAGIIAAFILTVEWLVYFAYAPLVLIIEGVHGKKALKRAKKLVQGKFWPVLIRMIIPKMVFVLILVAAEWVIGYLIGLTAISITGLDNDLAAKLTTIAVTFFIALGAVAINPLLIISDYLLFDNLRSIEKE